MAAKLLFYNLDAVIIEQAVGMLLNTICFHTAQ